VRERQGGETEGKRLGVGDQKHNIEVLCPTDEGLGMLMLSVL
jgi:hypothetical protein